VPLQEALMSISASDQQQLCSDYKYSVFADCVYNGRRLSSRVLDDTCTIPLNEPHGKEKSSKSAP
jgi:hypothetical protein